VTSHRQITALDTLSAPHNSTVSASGTTVMRKYGVSNSLFNINPIDSSLHPVCHTQTQTNTLNIL